jgi:DNA-directed RNA polymerase subunit RPC12/RpoP
MPLTVPCLRCKTKFQVPSKFAGQKVRCTQCGCVLRLPSKEVIQAKKQAIASGAGSADKTAAANKQSQSPSNDVLDIVDMYEEAPSSGKTPAATATTASAAAEPPVLSCSHCEGLLYYDPNFANQTVACPHCGNHLIMPEL